MDASQATKIHITKCNHELLQNKRVTNKFGETVKYQQYIKKKKKQLITKIKARSATIQ